MNFYSIQFVVFLAAMLILYYTCLKKRQWVCLLAGSLVFYLWTGSYNFVFILLTGFTTWIGAIWMEKYAIQYQAVKQNKEISKEERRKYKEATEKKKKRVMLLVVVFNFAILAALKYFGLYSRVTGLLLPLGISFYTFQSIGYLLDCYHEKYKPQRNFARYMLFVSYFPQLIQGPINRYDKMEGQLYEKHSWDSRRMKNALLLILFGMVKKYAIANLLVRPIADILDNTTGKYPGSAILLGILLYSAQQYADFSGGIDVVLGVSKLFGIEMMPNFRQPYFSTSLADFWRRWHISLGAWMRDYVFYPFALTKPMQNLGKYAKKKFGKHIGRVLPAAIANLLVFFVVGLWHGSQWHFIFWGLYNGIVIAFSDFMEPVFERLTNLLHMNTSSKAFYVFRVIRTFIVVNIGWYFDRIENIKLCFQSMARTVVDFRMKTLMAMLPDMLAGYSLITFAVAFVAILFVFCNSVMKERGIDTCAWLERRNVVIRWAIWYFMIFLVLISFTCDTSNGGFMYANY